jgi:diguanylate cyclase (GGDEF)-like protein
VNNLAYHDKLTGLYNRTYFEEVLKLEFEYRDFAPSMFAILCLDLDNFKNINDTCGHNVGDKLLIQIAQGIKDVISDKHIVSRIGGDEFTIILRNVSTHNEIKEYADNLVNSLNRQINIYGNLFDVSASIGIAISQKDGYGIDELFKNADIAMYSAKNAGKGIYKFFNISMKENVIEKLNIETKLRDAIKNNELYLYYQPQINLKTMKITGFEALLRWNSHTFGNVSPEKFIPIAESNGQIISIGKWVLNEACKFGNKLNKLGLSNVYISVNISIVQLLSDSFLETVKNIIKETEMPPEFLELEITETLLMESFESVLNILDTLREMGIKISLDDFGKGYSSLTYLKHLPISTLKLDKLFIDDISLYTNKKGVTGLIVSIAHEMEMKVIAEGVEKKEQLDYLKTHNCDMIQGFLISKPLSEKDAIQMLNDKNSEKYAL